jgi:hypothetical protein
MQRMQRNSHLCIHVQIEMGMKCCASLVRGHGDTSFIPVPAVEIILKELHTSSKPTEAGE